MIREALVGTAIAAGAMASAGVAVADPSHYDTDVPGIVYGVTVTTPCTNWERFSFGRGAGGQALVCHFVTGNFNPAPEVGYWQTSYPLYGVQKLGAPCPNPRGSAAQSPDGLALFCSVSGTWKPQITDMR